VDQVVVNQELIDLLLSNSIRVRSDLLGSKLTTYNVGGVLKSLLEVNSHTEASFVIKTLKDFKIPYRVIGGGSNLILPDDGMASPIIRLGAAFRTVEYSEDRDGSVLVKVGGAVALMTLVRQLSEKGISGLEFAGGIPALIGGAVKMNAGAHGGEIFSRLKSISVVTQTGDYDELDPHTLNPRYRHSGLPEGALVLGAVLSLTESDPSRCSEVRAHLLAERKARQPLTFPSAGSVFKNPSPDKAAGWLIEQCGLRGFVIGGAKISDMHGNWIVNSDRQAKASDIISLIDLAKTKVKDQFGLELETEQIIW